MGVGWGVRGREEKGNVVERRRKGQMDKREGWVERAAKACGAKGGKAVPKRKRGKKEKESDPHRAHA